MASAVSCAIRFHLANGEKIVLPCKSHQSLAEVKDKIWQKKGLREEPRQFVFRLYDGELFFQDHETVGRVMEVAEVFREHEKEPRAIMEMMLLPLNDMDDAINRKANRISATGRTYHQGWLWRKSGTGSSSMWKRRWFVFQNLTLFCFESDKAMQTGQPALHQIPMGSCHFYHVPDQVVRGYSHVMLLKSGHVEKRDRELCAEEPGEMDKWLSVINGFNLRRVKSICVAVCEELIRRGLDIHGLFRVSGGKEEVANLKLSYDMGQYPKLSEYKDDHALSGLLKLSLRSMSEPLLTFDRYQDLVNNGT